MHFAKVAAYGAALIVGASAACPGVVRDDCPTRLAKRFYAVEEIDDGQLVSNGGDTVKQIDDGQLQVGGKVDRVQQAVDGQVQVQNPAEKKTEVEEKTTTVIDFVTEMLAPEPSTKFITVIGYNNETSNATMAAPLPPYANTTLTTSMQLMTQGSSEALVPPSSIAPYANTTRNKIETAEITEEASTKVVVVHQAPYANTTGVEHQTPFQTGGMPMNTQGASAPSNSTGESPLSGRCPDLTRARSGCVFGSSVISQHMVAANAEAPGLCDDQAGCVAYQIGPMMLVNDDGGVDSGNIGTSNGRIENIEASNEGVMMVMVNLLSNSPQISFDEAGTNEFHGSCDQYNIYDHACDVTG